MWVSRSLDESTVIPVIGNAIERRDDGGEGWLGLPAAIPQQRVVDTPAKGKLFSHESRSVTPQNVTRDNRARCAINTVKICAIVVGRARLHGVGKTIAIRIPPGAGAPPPTELVAHRLVARQVPRRRAR